MGRRNIEQLGRDMGGKGMKVGDQNNPENIRCFTVTIQALEVRLSCEDC